jgi:hypothetical protein
MIGKWRKTLIGRSCNQWHGESFLWNFMERYANGVFEAPFEELRKFIKLASSFSFFLKPELVELDLFG